jgi:legumain
LAIVLALAFQVSADNWAVIVAGSNGFSNYRHQADACHAYKILMENGYQADKVIVFNYNDAADSAWNPFPG